MGSFLSPPTQPPSSLLPVFLFYPVGKQEGEIRIDHGESLGTEKVHIKAKTNTSKVGWRSPEEGKETG